MGKRKPVSDFPIEALCSMIASGSSLRKACKVLSIPHNSALGIINGSALLSDQYKRARLDQADYYADQIVEITDTERDPNRARVRVDARKWIASKMLPKVYGDMPQQTNVNVQANVLVMNEDEQRKYQARLKALRDSSGPAQLKENPLSLEAGEGGAPKEA